MTDPTESPPLQFAKEPRETAIPRLVEQHGALLHGLARRLCRGPQEAEDLVQEVFMSAFVHWDQFEGRGDASAWLWTIAARACQRMHRKRVGEPERLLSLESDDGAFEREDLGVVPSSAPAAAERSEWVDRLRASVAELPQEFRMALVLKDIVGLSVHDVAAALDVPEGTVKSRVHRARLALRASLEAALPSRKVAPAAFERAVCLDLLAAKQDALDRGVVFPVRDAVVCERCQEIFRTLDLSSELCRDLGRGELPPSLRERIAAALVDTR